MKLEALPWIILFLPLLATAVITLFTLRCKTKSSLISFIAANGFQIPAEHSETFINWLAIGDLHADFGLKLDALSMMMLLVVTGVGGAIHIYSYGYMHGDPGFSRYFACLSLFTFSML